MFILVGSDVYGMAVEKWTGLGNVAGRKCRGAIIHLAYPAGVTEERYLQLLGESHYISGLC